jgi:hypothetical protein
MPEMLSDRFGAFEAIANSGIKLTRVAPEEELWTDVRVALSGSSGIGGGAHPACPARHRAMDSRTNRSWRSVPAITS